MTSQITLAGSARLRFATGTLMYFKQGLPGGLLSIAMPVWMAGLTTSTSSSTKSKNQGQRLFLCKPVPRHCALDQKSPEVHWISLAGDLRPAFLEDLGDRQFLWLFLCNVPSMFAFLIGHSFSASDANGWHHMPD